MGKATHTHRFHAGGSKKYEVFLYFCVYIFYLIFGLWRLYVVRDEILRIAKYNFANGWSVFGRARDDNNDELESFNAYVCKMWPWYVLHLAVSAPLSQRWPRWQSIGHAVVTVAALVNYMQPISIAVLSGLIFSYFMVAQTRLKRLIWILSAVWMLLIIFIKNDDSFREELGYTEYYNLIVIMSWSLLRGCSFALDRSQAGNSGAEERYTLGSFLGYILYMPTLVYGPLMSFQRYAVIWQQERTPKELRRRLLTLIWDLVRVLFWWMVLQTVLHFFYLHYMARDVFAIRLVQPAFSQHAVGYFMGQLFFLYYVISYGKGIAFARFDGMEPPQRPRCIGRIHFYSDMWKYFDEGLYEFLFHNIYSELCTQRSSLSTKLFATAATFAFVFLWHGCYTYVLIWSILNFGCLVAEKCFKSLTSSSVYLDWTITHLGTIGAQRLYALLATQIFIPAAFANVYFIAGREVGNFLISGAYLSGVLNYFALTFCSYCFFQCSEVILNVKTKSCK